MLLQLLLGVLLVELAANSTEALHNRFVGNN